MYEITPIIKKPITRFSNMLIIKKRKKVRKNLPKPLELPFTLVSFRDLARASLESGTIYGFVFLPLSNSLIPDMYY